jgi:hypothetical protein
LCREQGGHGKECEMTIIQIGRKDSQMIPMQFEFDEEMEAFALYALCKDHYREDDLYINMTESEEEDEDLHIGEDEGADEKALLRKLLESGAFINIKGLRGSEPMCY